MFLFLILVCCSLLIAVNRESRDAFFNLEGRSVGWGLNLKFSHFNALNLKTKWLIRNKLSKSFYHLI